MLAFDIDKYVKKESEAILRTVRKYEKLYFEFGGKLYDDHHATRVLPGFKSDSKLNLFEALKEHAELVICINSENIENDRIRSDYDTLYVDDCIKLIQKYRESGFYVSGVALTVFNNQPKALEFSEKLKKMGENVYFLKYIPNYPNDLKEIIKSFEESDFIKTTKPLVIMTSSGSASGKLSACLNQIYKEYKKGNKVCYAKYDLFPIWNLPVNHPLNVAFEAATADSGDEILVDPFYYEKYSIEVSNYNRDVKVFPVIKQILKLVTGKDIYSSPTEMVINIMKDAIVDEEIICLKAKEEVVRRYLTYWKQYLRGNSDFAPIKRVEYLMKKNNITINDLKIVPIAKELFEKNNFVNSIVLELKDGEILFIKQYSNRSMADSLLLFIVNKYGIIENNIFEQLSNVNVNWYQRFQELFNANDKLKKYQSMLNDLNGCNAHASFVLTIEDEQKIKSLGINITCEPRKET